MNTAEFKAALAVVEQDHQLVLDKIQALKEAVNCLEDLEGPPPRRLLDRLRQMNNYFATRFISHLDEEEKDLFPFLEQDRPQGPELVARLRQDHEEIRRKSEEFGSCLDIAYAVADELPRMVVRDLLAYGWELWELLDKHAHLETRALQERLARSSQDKVVPSLA